MPETLLAFETAVDVLSVIKDRDYQLLAEYAHPEKGIAFFPYPDADYNEVSVFRAEQIEEFDSDTLYGWGSEDASEKLIEMTANEYFDHFVYNKDLGE